MGLFSILDLLWFVRFRWFWGLTSDFAEVFEELKNKGNVFSYLGCG
jgi:hypothetical protein